MAITDISDAIYAVTGVRIPWEEAAMLQTIADDILFDRCTQKPTDEIRGSPEYIKAVQYQTAYLYEQGGATAAICGINELTDVSSESLGSYSVTRQNRSQAAISSNNTLSVSPLALACLKRLGLTSRWAYQWRYRNGCP